MCTRYAPPQEAGSLSNPRCNIGGGRSDSHSFFFKCTWSFAPDLARPKLARPKRLSKLVPDLLVFCFSFYLISPITLFMAPIPPLRRSGFQFRAEEIDDFLEILGTYLPISAQNWQTVADSHSENYPREQRTAESLHRKFQEISRRTGPTGDPTCPPYVIKAKAINRQLVQMIDASSDWWVGGRKE